MENWGARLFHLFRWKKTSRPKSSAMEADPSVLWSSAKIFLFIASCGITSSTLLSTVGSIGAPFLAHITKSTLPIKASPQTL